MGLFTKTREKDDMARKREAGASPPDQVISIIGPGMKVVGDCDTEGAVRIEGTVDGNVRAGKAVVVGEAGVVNGDIFTQDAVISGTVTGSLRAESRLEINATSRIQGEVSAGRMQLEEGAILNGTVQMGTEESGGSREEELMTPPLQETAEAGERA